MSLLERRRRDDPRREQTEAAFLDAATQLLSEGLPFADLNVSLVADRAKRTRTAFYAHFDDRRALLMRLVAPLESEGHAAIAPFLEGNDAADVRAAIQGLMDICRRREVLIRAVVEAAAYARTEDNADLLAVCPARCGAGLTQIDATNLGPC